MAQPGAPLGIVRRVLRPQGHVLPDHETQLVARAVEVLGLVARRSRDADHGAAARVQAFQHVAGALRVCGHLEGVRTGPHGTPREHGDVIDPQGQTAMVPVPRFGTHRPEPHGVRAFPLPGAHPHPVQRLLAHPVRPPQRGVGHGHVHGERFARCGIGRGHDALGGHRLRVHLIGRLHGDVYGFTRMFHRSAAGHRNVRVR